MLLQRRRLLGCSCTVEVRGPSFTGETHLVDCTRSAAGDALHKRKNDFLQRRELTHGIKRLENREQVSPAPSTA